MPNAGNRPLGKSYFARRIWHGPDDTCWHVWLARLAGCTQIGHAEEP